MKAKREKKPAKTTCTLKYVLAVEISQEDARRISLGGFMPVDVRDALIASVEADYQRTAGRERIARLGGM